MKTFKISRIAVALLLTVAIVMFIALASGAARAQVESAECGARGTYGYTGFGYTFAGNPLGFAAGVVSTNGIITLDPRNGTWSVREVEVVNGTVVSPQGGATFSGSLTINSDCTFDGTLPGLGTILVGVVVDHGKQVRAMTTIPGVQVNYVSTVRVSPETE